MAEVANHTITVTTVTLKPQDNAYEMKNIYNC